MTFGCRTCPYKDDAASLEHVPVQSRNQVFRHLPDIVRALDNGFGSLFH